MTTCISGAITCSLHVLQMRCTIKPKKQPFEENKPGRWFVHKGARVVANFNLYRVVVVAAECTSLNGGRRGNLVGGGCLI